eukprot:209991-Pelagomonas_calceolata.AAC.1
MRADTPGFKTRRRLPSDKQHMSRNPSSSHIGNQEELFVLDQSSQPIWSTLKLKVPDWRTWAYTDGTCQIQNGIQEIGAG